MAFRDYSRFVWHSGAGVVAAFQPVSSPSQLDSYQNIGAHMRMIGNYTASLGVAPTWTAQTGWTFDGATQYLISPIVPAARWSMLARFVMTGGDANYRWVVGSIMADWAGRFYLLPYDATTKHSYGNGDFSGWLENSGTVASGVMAISGTACYLNGISDGTIPNNTVPSSMPSLFIGCLNAAGAPNYYFGGSVQCLAIYSRILTADESWLASRQMQYCDTIPEYNAWARKRNYWIPTSLGRVGVYGVRPTIALPGGVQIRPGTGAGL